MFDGPLVVGDRVGHASLTKREVTDLVQECDVDVGPLVLALLDRPDVRGNRAIDLLQLLEFSRFLPVLRGVRHAFEADSQFQIWRPDDGPKGEDYELIDAEGP